MIYFIAPRKMCRAAAGKMYYFFYSREGFKSDALKHCSKVLETYKHFHVATRERPDYDKTGCCFAVFTRQSAAKVCLIVALC